MKKTVEAVGEDAAGVAYGVAAYLWWGLTPVYMKSLKSVPHLEFLAHRAVWSAVILGLVVLVSKRWRQLLRLFSSPQSLSRLFVTTLLIGFNWYMYIWAVNEGQLLQSSLGYFINPLVSVALGVIFLKEKLSPLRATAVALAFCGVLVAAFGVGTFPWVSVMIALTFALYGLMRKQLGVEPLLGLTVETLLGFLPCAAYLMYEAKLGKGAFVAAGPTISFLLMAAGPVTALPLLWFASSANRLRLSTLGMLQYISPTCQFLIAVFLFHEPLMKQRALSFAIIWCALFLVSWESFRKRRARER